MTKQLVPDSEQLMACYDDRTRDEMIKMMDEALAALPEDQRASAMFSIDTYSAPYDDSTYCALFMEFKRLETDEEEAKREADEKRFKDQQVKRDRAEFERLKKQFGI
jgi:hypothetical protein